MLRRYSHVFTVVKVFVGAHKRMTRELRLGMSEEGMYTHLFHLITSCLQEKQMVLTMN